MKNLLNIRPLFDPSLEVFGPKANETAVHSHPSIPIQTRQYISERGQLRETKDTESKTNDKQNQRPAEIAHAPGDYLFRENEHSSNGFFEHVLAEHARHNRHTFPYLPQRRGLAVKQNDTTTQVNSRCETNSVAYKSTGQNNCQKENFEQQFHWQHNNEQRHRPSMFDDLRYHARLVLSAEVNVRKSDTEQDVKVTVEGNGLASDIKVEESNTENEVCSATDAKMTEKEQMDLIRERIIKENQKLKYRPYSLRSKRNDIKKNNKRLKKKKLKKKSPVKNFWKPTTPQELFLAQFGLMKKMLEPPKQTEKNGTSAT